VIDFVLKMGIVVSIAAMPFCVCFLTPLISTSGGRFRGHGLNSYCSTVVSQ